MDTRQLGNSDLHITPIGLGAWAIGGGGTSWSWSDQDDDDSTRAIHAALDAGMNWIDTAPAYGFGHSEEVIGRALKGRANKPYIFTKCHFVWDENDKNNHTRSLKRESLRQQVEDSLRRLQTDTIDLYQIHWPEPEDELEEGWEALSELQREGKVRYIAVSNFSVEQMERIAPIAPITALQPPYSLIRREIEADILPYCQRNNIGVLVYSPMQSGLLSGKMTRERLAALPENDFRRRNPQFVEPNLTRNLALADAVKEIAASNGVEAGAVAIAWTLRHPAVTAAIVGIRNPAQVDDVIVAPEITLTDADAAHLESFVPVS